MDFLRHGIYIQRNDNFRLWYSELADARTDSTKRHARFEGVLGLQLHHSPSSRSSLYDNRSATAMLG